MANWLTDYGSNIFKKLSLDCDSSDKIDTWDSYFTYCHQKLNLKFKDVSALKKRMDKIKRRISEKREKNLHDPKLNGGVYTVCRS